MTSYFNIRRVCLWMGLVSGMGAWSGWIALVANDSPVTLNVVWPTPNPSFFQGKDPATYLQPTVSGRLESALFGCVRNDGFRFHEGVDLKAIDRDSRNEATDPIYAAFPGKVVHINTVAGNSSYGRYIVLEHPDFHPAVYTLYAHLKVAAPGLSVGQGVLAGDEIGIMGRSAGGYTIPKSRAHLHFEIGLRLSDDFDSWYRKQRYESENKHGLWNGMNLVGFDPVDFFQKMMQGQVAGPIDFLNQEPVAVSLRIYTQEIPDFVKRYPSLIAGSLRNETLQAWDVDFSYYNLPLRWIPRYASDGIQGDPGNVQLLEYDRALIEANACRSSLKFSGENPTLGRGLKMHLELLFDIF